MQRITLALTDDAAERFERFIRERGYTNRSEAFRDLLRQADAIERLKDAAQPCAAVVSYVYNHHERQLAARMTEHQHEHGDVVHSVMHVHVSHEDCLEAIVLFGHAEKVTEVANRILAEPGVRNGRVNTIPLDKSEAHHVPAAAFAAQRAALGNHEHEHPHRHD